MGFLDDYEPVEDRIREFWSDYPTGRIETTLLKHEGADYIVQASVYRDELDIPSATGLAHDSYDQLPQNMKASALETCETSAIGRALANLGYAPKGKRPSREEMTKSSRGAGGSPGPAIAPSDPTSAESGDTGSPRNADDTGRGGDPGEASLPFPDLWQGLYDWFDGSKVRARNAVARANKINVTASTEHQVTEAQLEAAIKFVAEN